MYSIQEASKLRQEFWTVFGQYMLPVLSSEHNKVNWLNYKTGVKDIFFRLKATQKTASVNIEITSKDEMIRGLYFEQFKGLKNILEERTAEKWTWLILDHDENEKPLSRIFKEVADVNVLNKKEWPALISFFKPRIIALDDFWTDVKYSWETFC